MTTIEENAANPSPQSASVAKAKARGPRDDKSGRDEAAPKAKGTEYVVLMQEVEVEDGRILDSFRVVGRATGTTDTQARGPGGHLHARLLPTERMPGRAGRRATPRHRPSCRLVLTGVALPGRRA